MKKITEANTRDNYIFAYYNAIKSGKVIAGAWVRKVYEILTDRLRRGIYFYEPKNADRAVRFIEEFCRHCKGRRDLITLELWQKALVSAVFGVVDKDGYRQFNEIVVIIGKKNGKTLLAAAIMAYAAYVDNEYGAEIYCVATKLDQAKLAFDAFHQMILKEPELCELAKKRRSDIYIEKTNTSIMPLPFNAKKADGLNPHLVVNDEIASWRGDAGLKQYEALRSAFGARKQAFVFNISTAGYENNGIFDELFSRATAFLKGKTSEKRLLPFLYIIDDAEKWSDSKELRKANPNMDVSVPLSFFKNEIRIAKNSASKRGEFLVKYCNIKQNSSVAWLEYNAIRSVNKTLADFRGSYAVGGLDLSQTTDLTAASAVIEKDGILYGFCQFFMPACRLETGTAIDGVPYDIFVKKGVVTLSGENYVDYRDVYDWFVNLKEKHDIYVLKIGYDRYSAKYLVDDLKTYGYHTDDVFQGENLAPVIREFEGLIKDKKFIIGGNELLKAHFLNVALKHNLETRKFRPVKIEQRARIDGFVSIIDAITVRQKYHGEIGELLKNN